MNMNKLKHVIAAIMLVIAARSISAEVAIHSFVDLGQNNASEEVFVKNVYRVSYRYNQFNITGGLQFDLKSINPNTLTGFNLIGAGDISIKGFPLKVKGFFMLNRFSDILYETNWGARLETKKYDHFIFDIGIYNRTYVINSTTREEYNIDKSDSKLREYFNFTYLISA
jgi:hypothetical protein